jgi:Ca2+-binding RTX toxin-like protein
MSRLTTTLAVCAGALAVAAPATADAASRTPTTGASLYTQKICTSASDWDGVSPGITVDPAVHKVFVGGHGVENFLHVEVDGQGTTSGWDDMLQITLTTYGDLAPDVESVETPLYEPGDAGGGNGDFTTGNTPRTRAVKRIVFLSSLSKRTAVLNESSVPMHARGWFDTLDSGDDGFIGGNGPDCVEAVTGKGQDRDNRINTGDGSNKVRTGFGDDSVSGGDDNDTLITGSGDDVLRGGYGVDLLQGAGDSDCYSCNQLDGRRDLMDDPSPGLSDLNTYTAEPGVVDGEAVDTIERITEAFPTLVASCV